MNRKAILIESSNVKGQTDLPGARIDIENWDTFLRSDLGGAWKDSEIRILRKPFSSDVKTELDVASDCYCFVAFSGHGADGSVVLNDILSSLSITEITPKGERGTLIVDSCRGIAGARKYAFAKMEKFANQSREEIIAFSASRGETMALHESRLWVLKSAGTTNSCFERWVAALKQSSTGIVQMLSCAKGQGANEDPNSGGHYTSLLMQSADLWSKRTTAEKIHNTRSAHDYAAANLPIQQTPEYSPSMLYFPFAAKT